KVNAMSKRIYPIYVTLIGLISGEVTIRYILSPNSLSLHNALIQGFFIGFGLAVVTVEILAKIKATKVNGWVTAFDCGLPGNGIFTRAAHARLFPGPINIPEEAMYWWTHVDGAGHTLNGEHNYLIHFSPGGLPPNDAFWSLTMADAKNRFVKNPINRYCVSDRSGLLQNPDGSTDIYIQNKVPTGHESNWLPAPTDTFNIWLRVYIPGKAILDGKYMVPPVAEVKSKQ
ncbi:MAG: DUF1214 domain-containing protein, partial [Bacteroidota bacterium]|nr:DUF1214 domain-containing protein [Bacteroidota bacterium]